MEKKKFDTSKIRNLKSDGSSIKESMRIKSVTVSKSNKT